MTDKPQINIRLSQDLHAAVKNAAKMQGISLNQYVVDTLAESISSISVPLRAVGNKDGAGYTISIPPEWFFLEPVLCGQQDIHNNIYLCKECAENSGGTGIGCGKKL